jgi:excisionase family DNA binding protein
MDRLQQIGMSPEEAAKVAGVGRSLIFQALKQRKLEGRKAGRRTIITKTALECWLGNLPKVGEGIAA